MQKKIIWLIFLFLVFQVSAISLPKSVKITVDDGLINGNIHQISQDSQGFIWLATENGLVRYDGFDYKVFQSVPNNEYSISHNFINAVSSEINLSLWVGTMSGVDRYDPITGKFEHFYFYNDLGNVHMKPALQICPVDSGCFIRSDDKKIYFCKIGDKVIRPIKYKDYYSNTFVSAIDLFDDETLIAGNKSGQVFSLSRDGNVSIIAKDLSPISEIQVLLDKRICVTTSNGEILIFKNRRLQHKYNLTNVSDSYITDVKELNDSTIAIGTRSQGIYKLIENKGLQGVTDLNLVNKNCSALLLDKFGNLWIGHSFGGVSICLNQTIDFSKDKISEQFKDKNVLAITKYKTKTFVGTDGNGLFIYDEKTKECKSYTYSSGLFGIPFDNVVTSLFVDDEYLWIGTYSHGIFALSLKTGQLAFVNQLLQCPAKSVSTLFVDSKDNVWVGTYESGVFVFSKKTKMFNKHYTGYEDDEYPSISCNGSTCFFEDNQSNIWIGSYYGITKIPISGRSVIYSYDKYLGMRSSVVTTITQNTDGKIWFGSLQGLSFYDAKKDTIIALKNSLNVNEQAIYGIVPQKDSSLLIVTPKHIYVYSQILNDFRFVSTLQEGEFRKNSFCVDNKQITLGTDNGIKSLLLPISSELFKIHSLNVTDVLVKGLSVFTPDSPYEIILKDNKYYLELPYYETDVTFCFSDFYFDKTRPRDYEYKLQGVNSDWVALRDDNTVNYTNLQGGDYVFLVKHIANNSDAEIEFHIYIEKPFWEHSLFYVILVVAIIFIICIIFLLRMKKVIRMRNRLQRQVELRLQDIKRNNEQIKNQNIQIQLQRDAANRQRLEAEQQRNKLEQEQKQLLNKVSHKDDYIRDLKQKSSVENKKNRTLIQQLSLFENNVKEVVFNIIISSAKIDYVSPSVAELTGYEATDFYNGTITVRNLFEDEAKDTIKRFMAIVEAGKTPRMMKYRIKTKNKNNKWIMQFCRLEKNQDGKAVALNLVMFDITRQKDLESQIWHKQKFGEFAKSLNINNTINPVLKSFYDLLKQEDISLDEKAASIETNEYSSTSVLQKIEDIIDISKIKAGKLHLNYSQCYVNVVLRELNESFQSLIVSQKLSVVLRLKLPSDGDNFSFYTDTYRFRQIVLNLVGNALKYTHKGTVEFGYTIQTDFETESDGILILSVKDSGKKFPEEMLEYLKKHVFDKEFVDIEHGTGLIVVYKLVALLGGTIECKRIESGGTDFQVSLPLERMKGLKYITEDSDVDRVRIEEQDWSGKTLLVVDDDEHSFNFIKESIEATHINILWAKDGWNAVDVYKKRSKEIDLILMDLQLPKLNGLEAIREIRKFDKHIPIIAQTLYGNFEAKLQCFDVGCDTYISKPYRNIDLQEILLKYIEK